MQYNYRYEYSLLSVDYSVMMLTYTLCFYTYRVWQPMIYHPFHGLLGNNNTRDLGLMTMKVIVVERSQGEFGRLKIYRPYIQTECSHTSSSLFRIL